MKNTTHLFELKKLQSDFPCIKITCSKSAADFIRQFYSDDIEIYESMFLLLLNRANNTIGYAKISQGGVSGTVCDPKIICKYVADSMASSAMLCHNHPSGNINPSSADIQVSNKVKQALDFLDCTLLDSLILSTNDYYSLADNGNL